MVKMTPPTEEGWYWYRFHSNEDWEPAKVVSGHVKYGNPIGTLWVTLFSISEVSYLIDQVDTGEWGEKFSELRNGKE